MIYYVCSFGGCGSTALARHLGQFGERVFHIHSRCPPPQLTEVDLFTEHFTDVPVDARNVRVIFIYRDPVKSILSRFDNPAHIKNIEAEPATLAEVVRTGTDLFRLDEFFDNYLDPKRRNYPVLFVKYEALFTHLPLLHRLLGIKSALTIKRKETVRQEDPALKVIYEPLARKMKAMPPIWISK
jgi:hypothetical protein